MTRDEPADKFVYHGGACAHPACQWRTLQLAIRRAEEGRESRRRNRERKTRVEFNPFAIGETYKW